MGQQQVQCFIAWEGHKDFGFTKKGLRWESAQENSCVGGGGVGVDEWVRVGVGVV